MTLEERNKKVEENLPLVTFCLNKLNIGFNEDYFQQGVLELIRCVDNFDDRKGHKFSAYAVKNIKLYLKEYIARDKVIKPKRTGYKGRVYAPPCESFQKVIYSTGADEEITLGDTIAAKQDIEDNLLMYDLDLMVEKKIITREQLDIFLGYHLQNEGKQYLIKKYHKSYMQITKDLEDTKEKIKKYLSYNN